VHLLIILISLVILNQASHLTITNAVKVSDITQLGKTAVGFSLLAFSTSLPELSVAFIAAFTGEAAISVGNVLGSNIVNICLVVGLAALIISLRHRSPSVSVIPSFAKEELGSLHFGLFVSSVIPLSLVYIAEASWLVGLILILIFVFYTYKLSKIRIPPKEGSVPEDEKKKLRRYTSFTFLGVVGVILSAYFLVESAVAVAEFAGIPRTLIGATVIAFGTSLPELTLDLKAFLKGHSALAFGDIIGSSFVNITLILGITLYVPLLIGSPLTMNMLIFQDLVIFSLIVNLFFWYFLSMGKLSWKEGAIFLFLYLLFLASTLGLIQPRQQTT